MSDVKAVMETQDEMTRMRMLKLLLLLLMIMIMICEGRPGFAEHHGYDQKKVKMSTAMINQQSVKPTKCCLTCCLY